MAATTTDDDNAMEKGQAGGPQLADSSLSASRSSSWFSAWKGSLTMFSTSTLGAESSGKPSALRRLWHRITGNASQQQGKTVRSPVIVQKCEDLFTTFDKL